MCNTRKYYCTRICFCIIIMFFCNNASMHYSCSDRIICSVYKLNNIRHVCINTRVAQCVLKTMTFVLCGSVHGNFIR